MYVSVMDIDQAVPYPWGISVYEEFDPFSPGDFFFNWHDAKTVSTPDFLGKRVTSYLKWLKLSNTLIVIKKAFPACASGNVDEKSVDPFERCLSEFEHTLLQQFSELCATNEGEKMFSKAIFFQKLSVLKWNPHIDEPTKSIYLGLVGIDESAAKECGAILLDLLLRCGVLVQTTNGEWILADNWEARWRQEHEAPSQRDERRR